MEQKGLKRAEEHRPISIKLTDEQKKQIVKYMRKSGRQIGVSLQVDVVDDKIAPAALSIGAV